MLFNSLTFVLFFAVVYSLYVVSSHRQQNRLLLVASYFFYGCWDWRFLSLILISTVVDYCSGLAIHRTSDRLVKRVFLAASVGTNLGILFLFKYFGFFVDSLERFLEVFGTSLDWRVTSLVLPVGISFYTFQTLSYSIDVYLGKLRPTRDFLDFALFVAFFPQLVAGPIERAKTLLPQITGKRTPNSEMVRDGLRLILLGYCQKVVLADNMTPFTRPMFEEPQAFFGLSVIVGVYAAAFQIYGDFAGYSNIARGLAKVMGFDLMVNFNRPYLAANPGDFWRRWHISLSTWLRDYLYIPLGGNRHGKLATHRNLMITMLLGGLWHGAAWNFVAWGLFHGTLLSIHRVMRPSLERIEPQGRLGRIVWKTSTTIGFFHLTCLGWLLFFVKSLGDVPLLLRQMIDPFVINIDAIYGILTILAFAGPIVLLEAFQEIRGVPYLAKFWPRPVRFCCYACAVVAIILCGDVGQHEFVYFQF